MDRHLGAKADRAPKTVATDRYHSESVRESFGDRYVATLDTTEIETWSQRTGTARSSRKKQLEILRAAIKRGMRDDLVDKDPTEDLVVSLGHKELPHYSSAELIAILGAASNATDRAMLSVLGLMGLRCGEALSLSVGDVSGGVLSVKNSGFGSDTTKTRASRRNLPVPGVVLPLLQRQAAGRPKGNYLFSSPRDPEMPRSEKYVSGALTRAVTGANLGRTEKIPRLTVHGLRHTFAAISLSEIKADILSVSRAMGHARPSVTLDRYGHLAPVGLSPLMAQIDDLVSPQQEQN